MFALHRIMNIQTNAAIAEFHEPILVFGGVYSNIQALDQLFREAEKRDIPPSRMICTGDIIAYGANGRDCIERIRDIGVLCIAGNCEEQLALAADDCGCGYAPGSTGETLSQNWFAHARTQINESHRAWMAGLPSRLKIVLNEAQFCVVHGSYSEINRFIFPSTPSRIKASDLDQTGVDGIIAGHSGLPFSQTIDGRLWHNSGALGMPANDGTPRVWFSILSPGETPKSVTIEHLSLEYDHADAAENMRRARLPDDYSKTLMDGLWPDCGVLPKDELEVSGNPLTPEILHWNAGTAEQAAWPALKPRNGVALDKFSHKDVTADGQRRAHVALDRLETLWINTGTLCNLACASCYIESTPRNDKLVYISALETQFYLDEIKEENYHTKLIGLTGGEPFMNPEIISIMERILSGGFELMVLTNAMKPMRRFERQLEKLQATYGEAITIRVSLDHYAKDLHELERGPRSWDPALDGLRWLASKGFTIHVAGRQYSGEPEEIVRAGYAQLFGQLGLGINANDPIELVLFPEMDEMADVPEITESCWGILDKDPNDVMCASSRMVVKRKGADKPAVLACTLLAYDDEFELGTTLKEASGSVSLNHPHCAKFCVLGGAACSR